MKETFWSGTKNKHVKTWLKVNNILQSMKIYVCVEPPLYELCQINVNVCHNALIFYFLFKK